MNDLNSIKSSRYKRFQNNFSIALLSILALILLSSAFSFYWGYKYGEHKAYQKISQAIQVIMNVGLEE